MASVDWKGIIEDEKQEVSPTNPDERNVVPFPGAMKELPAPPAERPVPWAKNHCDYLLDSIDAQLSRLQAQGLDARTQGSSGRGMGSVDGIVGTFKVSDLGGCSGAGDGAASAGEDLTSWKGEHIRGAVHHLDPEGTPGDQSNSDSVCTEDLAAKFHEGLVDPLLSSEEEEEEDAVFPLAVLPRDIRRLECTAWGRPGNASHLQTFVVLEAASDSCSVDSASKLGVTPLLKKASEGEWGRDLTLSSGQPPSLQTQPRVRSPESLGEKISWLSHRGSDEASGAMDPLGDSLAWRRRFLHRPLSSGEKPAVLGMEVSQESALLEPRTGRKGLEGSLEGLQDTPDNSNSPLLVEDLGPLQTLQTAKVAAVRTAVSDGEDPARMGRRGCPEEGPSACPRGWMDVPCLCALGASHESCLVPSHGEGRGGLIAPWCVSHLMSHRPGKMQRLAQLGLGTNTDVNRTLGASQKPLGLASKGCIEHRKNWVKNIPCSEGHTEALELMQYGRLGAERHAPHCGLDEGRRERFRGRRGTAAGQSTTEASLPQKGFPRSLGSSDASAEEEEELPGLCTDSSWRPSPLRKQPPSTAAEPGLKEAALGAFRSCKVLPAAAEKPRCGSWGFPSEVQKIRWAASDIQAAPGTVRHRAGPLAESRLASLVQLEGCLRKLQQDLALEEEKLGQKKAQIREADASLYSVLQQKKHVSLELEAFQEALEESQKEARRLELLVEDNRGPVDEARADLVLLGYKREASLQELRELEKELSGRKRQSSQYGTAQVKVSRLTTEREGLKDQVRHLEDNLSSLKLQLRSSKAELSSVKGKAGIQSEQLQQAILSEKEMELSSLRRTVSALEAEKEDRAAAAESMEEEYKRQLEVVRQESLREKGKELLELREELQQEKQRALREFAESMEQAKASALQEQASTFQKEIENLCKTVEERDVEVAQRQEAMQEEAKELKQQAKEMVQNALLQERKKWEADTRAALQMQRETLREQDRRMLADLQEALERERKSSRVLQDETTGLHERIQQLESEARSFQCDKRVAMEEIQAVLRKEKLEALRRLREELEQERKQERESWRAELLQQMEGWSEASFRERESQGHAGQANGSLAREVAFACQQLQDSLPKAASELSRSKLLQGLAPLSSSRALQALQELCEETRRYIQDLEQKTETQQHHILQVQREKDQELKKQQEELHLESQSALEALKEQLVQEHMENIAALQRGWWKEAGLKENLMNCPQRQEKGVVGQALQGIRTPWKDMRASEFKEELDTQLERRLSREKTTDVRRDLETPESEIGQFSMGYNKYLHSHSVHSPSLNGALFSSQRHSSTPKLLCHLRSRIRELQAENAMYCRGSLDNLSSFREDLAQAYRSRRQLTPELSSSQLHGRSGWK